MLSNPAALTSIREQSGHTQASLSKVSDVAQSRISRFEANPTSLRPTTAKRLADALGVEIADITSSDDAEAVAP